MPSEKQKYIRNNIVFDPNIFSDPFDSDEAEHRKVYRSGKGKRKKYNGR